MTDHEIVEQPLNASVSLAGVDHVDTTEFAIDLTIAVGNN